jgi:hypothetical protein
LDGQNPQELNLEMSQSISQVPLVEAPAELRTAGHLNEIPYNLGGVATISFAFRVHRGDGHKTLEANLEEEIWQKLRMNWQGKTWPNSLQASLHAHCATRSAVISCHMLQTPSASKEEGATETHKMTIKFGCRWYQTAEVNWEGMLTQESLMEPT